MRRNSTSADPVLRPPGEDRRKWVRYPLRLTAICRAAPNANESANDLNGSTWMVEIRNISHGGLKLLCRRPLVHGAAILISPADAKVPPQIARVVHVTEGANGTKIVGCAFIGKLLGEKDLLAWIKAQNGKH